MAAEDWQPSPGRYLVVLPLAPPTSRGGPGCQAGAAAQAEQRHAELADLFRRERRLAFRRTAVSPACAQLPGAGRGQEGGGERGSVAFVLHPRRSRFLLLPLADARAAQLRLEAVLDGGGDWRQASASPEQCSKVASL